MYLDSILLAVRVNISSFGCNYSSLDLDLISIPVKCKVSTFESWFNVQRLRYMGRGE